jgi:hypothetical protein
MPGDVEPWETEVERVTRVTRPYVSWSAGMWQSLPAENDSLSCPYPTSAAPIIVPAWTEMFQALSSRDPPEKEISTT